MAIVGNKDDIYEKEMVDEDEAKAFANECNAIFLKTSAKDSYGIEDLFIKIGIRFLNQKLDMINQKDFKNNNYKVENGNIKSVLNFYKNKNEKLKNELIKRIISRNYE